MIQGTNWEAVVHETIAELAAGLTAVGLYGSTHPRAEQAVTRLGAHLGKLLLDSPEFTFVVIEDDLFVQGRPFTRTSRASPSLVRRFHRRGIEHVSFRKGIDEVELRYFLEAMAASDDSKIVSHPHLQVGTVQLADITLGGPDESSGGKGRRKVSSLRDRIGVLAEIFSDAAASGALAVGDLERVVQAILDNLDHDSDPLRQLAPWEGEERWPAVHAHNVCGITLGVARLAGVSTSWCIDLGLAALLHDVGKILSPPEVLSRELELVGDELEFMLDHPRLGLGLVLRNTQLPALAAIVAYEHHLRFNGTGYPRLSRPRRPHPATRLISVADAFVTLLTARGAMGVATRESVNIWLQEHSGNVLDPAWVEALDEIINQPRPPIQADSLSAPTPPEQ